MMSSDKEPHPLRETVDIRKSMPGGMVRIVSDYSDSNGQTVSSVLDHFHRTDLIRLALGAAVTLIGFGALIFFAFYPPEVDTSEVALGAIVSLTGTALAFVLRRERTDD